MTRNHLVGGIAFVTALTVSAAAFAQAKTAPKYDPASEITVTGTLKAVVSAQSPDGKVGVHVQLKTPNELVWVSLGPALFIGENNFYFFADDQVEITGATIGKGEDAAVWARIVTKGGKTLMLRNPDGTPRWKAADDPDGCGVTHDRIR